MTPVIKPPPLKSIEQKKLKTFHPLPLFLLLPELKRMGLEYMGNIERLGYSFNLKVWEPDLEQTTKVCRIYSAHGYTTVAGKTATYDGMAVHFEDNIYPAKDEADASNICDLLVRQDDYREFMYVQDLKKRLGNATKADYDKAFERLAKGSNDRAAIIDCTRFFGNTLFEKFVD